MKITSFTGYICGTDIYNKKQYINTKNIKEIEKFGNSTIVTMKDANEINFKNDFHNILAAYDLSNESKNITIDVDNFDLLDYWNYIENNKK